MGRRWLDSDMPYDLPDRFAMARRADAAFDMLEADILAEKASSLGHHGRLVETAMAALRDFDAQPGGDPEARLKLVKAAARQVWAFSYSVSCADCATRSRSSRTTAFPARCWSGSARSSDSSSPGFASRVAARALEEIEFEAFVTLVEAQPLIEAMGIEPLLVGRQLHHAAAALAAAIEGPAHHL